MVHVDYQVKDENIEKYFAAIRKVRDGLNTLRGDTFRILFESVRDGTNRWTECGHIAYTPTDERTCNLPKGHEKVPMDHAMIVRKSQTEATYTSWSYR